MINFLSVTVPSELISSRSLDIPVLKLEEVLFTIISKYYFIIIMCMQGSWQDQLCALMLIS